MGSLGSFIERDSLRLKALSASADAVEMRLVLLLLLAWLLAAAPAQAKPRDGVLRMVPDTNPEQGIYTLSGTLDGVRPPREPVKDLRITRLTGKSAEGLRPLLAFTDLRKLELEAIRGVDLAPLSQLHLDTLDIVRARNVDLSPIGAIPTLKRLTLDGLRDVHIPPALTLPPTLEDLGIGNDGFRLTGAPVKALISAIDWSRLGGLRYLGLHVGGGDESLRPIRVDLRLLAHLQRLRQLQIFGVWHDGSGHSPLDMPFPGLARTLRWVQIDAWRPRKVQRALTRRLRSRSISVDQRYAWKPGHGAWTIDHFDASWSTYGSFWDAADGEDGETEYEALATARRRIRAKAPRLLKRLEFDPEGSGTGVSAPSRRDLVRMLRILGIR
jgi:hypothetical protein